MKKRALLYKTVPFFHRINIKMYKFSLMIILFLSSFSLKELYITFLPIHIKGAIYNHVKFYQHDFSYHIILSQQVLVYLYHIF